VLLNSCCLQFPLPTARSAKCAQGQTSVVLLLFSLPADNLLESLPATMGGMTSLVKLQVPFQLDMPCGYP